MREIELAERVLCQELCKCKVTDPSSMGISTLETLTNYSTSEGVVKV